MREHYSYSSGKRRFYRSGRQALLTGVCAGVAEQFNWKLSTVRIVTIVSFLLFTPATLVAYVLTTLLTDKIG